LIECNIVKSFPSFRLNVTSKVNPILALQTLLTNNIIIKGVAFINLLFIDRRTKVIVQTAVTDWMVTAKVENFALRPRN